MVTSYVTSGGATHNMHGCNPAQLIEHTWNLKVKWDFWGSIVGDDPRYQKKFRLFQNCQLKIFDMSSWLKDYQPQSRKLQFVQLRCTFQLLLLEVVALLLQHDPTSKITVFIQPRDININNVVYSWWWPVSVNQSAAVTHPMMLCLHHLLSMCFVLFEDDDLVLQNSTLITTSAQTHMQNQVFTGIQSHIAEVISKGI